MHHIITFEDEDPRGRDKREERQFQTRLFGDVQVVVKDPNFPDEFSDEHPLTLAPKLVRDGFAVQRQSATELDASPVVKTEYSTFTYFVTSIVNGETITNTDIVVSSNVVTEAGIPEATPLLEIELQPSSSPSDMLATKTYFTTSTYYTTLLEGSTTITKTRTKVKSTIVTETFSDDEINAISPSRTVLPPSLVPGEERVKYLSLGPNIYGQIRTFFNTYTYFTTNAAGDINESKEVITQISTSLFSTTQLPNYITLEPSQVSSGTKEEVIQLNRDKLSSIKQAFQSTVGPSASIVPSVDKVDISGSIDDSGPSVNLEPPFLSSLKESFESSLSSVDITPTRPVSDLNLPSGGPGVLSPPQSISTTPGSVGSSQTLTTPSSSFGSSAGGVPGGSTATESPPSDGSSQGNGSPNPGDGTNDNDNTIASGGDNPGDASGDNGNDDGGTASGNQPIGGGSQIPNQGTDPATSSPSGADSGNETTDGPASGGVLDAVVDGLGGVFGGATPNVNLGPVLDAVATLLRGPIRSAIANRRNELTKKSDDIDPTQIQGRIKASANLPSFAHLPSGDPNFIPVGGIGKLKPSRPNYEFIPLRQRDVNGPVPLPLRAPRPDSASPRIDIDDSEFSESSTDPVVAVPQDVYEALKSQNSEDTYVLDNDRLIINDHIIKSTDPHIVDVLNRFEQSHLFGKYEGHPMSIKIVPGLPMNYPSQVNSPGDAVQRGDYVYIGGDDIAQTSFGGQGAYQGPPRPVHQNPGPPRKVFGSKRPPPPPGSAPQRQSSGPPPNRPPFGSPPQKRPPQGPQKRPSPGPPPRQPPRPVRRPPLPSQGGPNFGVGNQQYPTRSQPRPVTNDLNDSVNEYSINNEIIVKAPPNLITQGNPKPQSGSNPNNRPFPGQQHNGRPYPGSQSNSFQRPQPRPNNGKQRPSRPNNLRPPFQGQKTRPPPQGGYRGGNRPNFINPHAPDPTPNFGSNPDSRPLRPNSNGPQPFVNQKPGGPIPSRPQDLSQRPQSGPPQRPPQSGPPQRPPQQGIPQRPPQSQQGPPQRPPPPPQGTPQRFPPSPPQPGSGFNSPPRGSDGKPLAPPKRQIPSGPVSGFQPQSQPQSSNDFGPNGIQGQPQQGNNYGVTPKQPYQSGPRPGFKAPPLTTNEIIPQTPDEDTKVENPFQKNEPIIGPGPSQKIPNESSYEGQIIGVSSEAPEVTTTQRTERTSINPYRQNPVRPSLGRPPRPQPPQLLPRPIVNNLPQRKPATPFRRPPDLRFPRPSVTTPTIPTINDRLDTTRTEFLTPENGPTTPKILTNFNRPRPAGLPQRPPRPVVRRPPTEYTPIDNPSDGPPGSQVQTSINLEPSIGSRPSGVGGSFGDKVNPLKARQPVGDENVGGQNSGSNVSPPKSDESPLPESGSVPQEIDPSFSSSSNKDSVPVTKGIFVKPQSGSNGLDYQGWYTEGDSVPIGSSASSSSPYIEYTINEKDAAKTTTYANEWAIVDQSSTVNPNDPFADQKRPAINTNFDREWTVRDEIIRPSKPTLNGQELKPTEASYTNSWGSFDVKPSDVIAGSENPFGNTWGSVQRPDSESVPKSSRPNAWGSVDDKPTDGLGGSQPQNAAGSADQKAPGSLGGNRPNNDWGSANQRPSGGPGGNQPNNPRGSSVQKPSGSLGGNQPNNGFGSGDLKPIGGQRGNQPNNAGGSANQKPSGGLRGPESTNAWGSVDLRPSGVLGGTKNTNAWSSVDENTSDIIVGTEASNTNPWPTTGDVDLATETEPSTFSDNNSNNGSDEDKLNPNQRPSYETPPPRKLTEGEVEGQDEAGAAQNGGNRLSSDSNISEDDSSQNGQDFNGEIYSDIDVEYEYENGKDQPVERNVEEYQGNTPSTGAQDNAFGSDNLNENEDDQGFGSELNGDGQVFVDKPNENGQGSPKGVDQGYDNEGNTDGQVFGSGSNGDGQVFGSGSNGDGQGFEIGDAQGLGTEAYGDGQAFGTEANEDGQRLSTELNGDGQGFGNVANGNGQGFGNVANGDGQGFGNEANGDGQGFDNEANEDGQGFGNEANGGDQGFGNEANDDDQGLSNEAVNGDDPRFGNEAYGDDQGYGDYQGFENSANGDVILGGGRRPIRPTAVGDPFQNPGTGVFNPSVPPTPFGPQPRPPLIRNPRPPFRNDPYDPRAPLPPNGPFRPHLSPNGPFRPQRPRPRPNGPPPPPGFQGVGEINLISKIPFTPLAPENPDGTHDLNQDPNGSISLTLVPQQQDAEGPIKGTVESVNIPRPFGPPLKPGTRVPFRPVGEIEGEGPNDLVSSQETSDSALSSSSADSGSLPPGIEPDTGTFINIGPSGSISGTDVVRPSLIRPTILRPSIRPTAIQTPGVINKEVYNSRPTNRPAIFPPRVTTGTGSDFIAGSTEKAETNDPTTDDTKEEDPAKTPENEEEEEETFKLAGSPYLPSIGQKPGLSYKPNSVISNDDEVKRKEILGNNIDGAIVESIPGKALSAEDSDPETTCQNTCGKNEICQIYSHEIRCKCRPGFGRSDPAETCEKSRSYTLEMLTQSESEDITVIRMSPKAVQKAVEDTVKREIKDSYHGSSITAIKVGNETKREILFFGGVKNLTKDESLSIQMVVHIADDGRIISDKRLQTLLEDPIKNTKLPLGAEITVSRVSVQDFDECSYDDHNDCSDQAQCINQEGSYTCSCKEGYHDLSGSDTLPGRVCSATTTECDLCNRNGECIIRGQDVTCECRDWFAGRNCQINLKLLLIVGCVSVALMIFIACGVSCFCCRDRQKNLLPSPYGTSTVSRIPPSVRSQGLVMDPHGTLKSSRSGMVQKHKPKKSSLASSTNFIPRPGMKKQGSTAGSHHSGNMKPAGSWQSGLAPGEMRMHPNPALVIPRARVSKSPGRFSFNSDDEFMAPAETNRAMSERTSLSSRHRRKSVPSFVSGFSQGGPGSMGGASRRSSQRAGSVDPLLAGDFSDDSNGGQRSLHRSVPRGDLDRADAQSVARSYNETIIRPVTRPLHTPAGTSYRSNRSHATSEDGRTMAERDGGSSFVVSPTHQLYRLHDSDGSLDSL